MKAGVIVTEELNGIVLAILARHVGREFRIGRQDLVERVALELHIEADERLDRNIRDAIEKVRGEPGEGSKICSSSSKGGGYWLAANAEELEVFLAEDGKRVRTIFARNDAQRQHGLEELRARPLEQGRLIP